MPRLVARALAGIAIFAIACSIPTDTCACSPMVGGLYIIGAVRDAADAPVVGARIGLAAAHPQAGAPRTIILDSGLGATNEAGEFRGTVSDGRTGPLTLYAAVLRPGAADTIRLQAGSVTFGLPGAVPDTMRIILRLP